MNFYEPIFFKPYEFVDTNTYSRFGDNSLFLIDTRMLITMDRIRKYLNKPIIINNWKHGGRREWSGLRTPISPFFSTYSQHSFGRAIDFIVSDIDAKEVRQIIKNNYNLTTFEFVTSIEDFPGMSWVHIDCRNWDKNNNLFVFSK